MTSQEIPSFKDALNEYFKLKNKFENDVNAYKKKIINNITLSKREKRSEFLKIMPKCVNCKRPSKKGTLFSTTFIPETEKTGGYRKLSAVCGNLVDPCNLDIEIHIGETEPLDKLITNVRNEIKTYKNKIIDDKNKLLFGLITTEKALENFDFNKTYINDLTSIYELYLDKWNKIVDNPEKKTELEDAFILSYENIDKIKKCIKQMNEKNDSQFAATAANIYITTLKPLLDKIRHLKYSENIVYHDDYYNNCRLIQLPYSELDLAFNIYDNKIIKYNVGLQAKTINKKKPGLFIIESDEDASDIEDKKEFTIKIQDPDKQDPDKQDSDKQDPNKQKSNKEIPQDEPIIGKGEDGIDWNIEEYKQLWKKLPKKLKTEFKLNIDWMKDFMYNCVNAKQREGVQYNGCRLTTPSKLIIPPKQLESGQYDFGVSIYNIAFNKLSKSLQETYLSLYILDTTTKEKNYNMLIDSMNKLVENEVDFGRGFF